MSISPRVTKIFWLRPFLFFQQPYLDKRSRYIQHRGMTKFCLMAVVNHLYILERGAALRKILVEHNSLIVQDLKRHLLVSQKKRYDWNHLMTNSLKSIHSIYYKSAVWPNLSNAFCRSARIITAWNTLSIFLKIKSASRKRQDSVKKIDRKPDWYL